MTNHTFYRVVLPYAVAGVVVFNGKVSQAPPILQWARHKTVAQLKHWVKQKKGTIEEMPEVMQ